MHERWAHFVFSLGEMALNVWKAHVDSSAAFPGHCVLNVCSFDLSVPNSQLMMSVPVFEAHGRRFAVIACRTFVWLGPTLPVLWCGEQLRFAVAFRSRHKMSGMGVYVPPFKAARLAAEGKEQSDEQKQRASWEGLRKGINGVVNKVNIANISKLLPELFSHNLVRGRGLLARSLMKAQQASPGFTHIYAAVIAVVNTRLPENGELLLKRVIIQFRRAFRRRNKVSVRYGGI